IGHCWKVRSFVGLITNLRGKVVPTLYNETGPEVALSREITPHLVSQRVCCALHLVDIVADHGKEIRRVFSSPPSRFPAAARHLACGCRWVPSPAEAGRRSHACPRADAAA